MFAVCKTRQLPCAFGRAVVCGSRLIAIPDRPKRISGTAGVPEEFHNFFWRHNA